MKQKSYMLRQNQTGSSLIEVMVALFVLGIGLLGVLAMQAKSVQMNQNAYLYSQAAFLANNIIESMRATPEAAGFFAIALTDPTPSAGPCNDKDAKCSMEDIAVWSVKQWRESIASSLPDGRSAVVKNGDLWTITIEFDDRRGDSNEPPIIYEASTEL